MIGFLDTSVVVRYLTGTPPELAHDAAAVIDQIDGLQTSGLAISETAYVLTTVYRIPRQNVVDHLMALIGKANISTYALDKSLVLQALLSCRPSPRVSFADDLIWAAARLAGPRVVYSLDE